MSYTTALLKSSSYLLCQLRARQGVADVTVAMLAM